MHIHGYVLKSFCNEAVLTPRELSSIGTQVRVNAFNNDESISRKRSIESMHSFIIITL